MGSLGVQTARNARKHNSLRSILANEVLCCSGGVHACPCPPLWRQLSWAVELTAHDGQACLPVPRFRCSALPFSACSLFRALRFSLWLPCLSPNRVRRGSTTVLVPAPWLSLVEHGLGNGMATIAIIGALEKEIMQIKEELSYVCEARAGRLGRRER